MSRAISVFVGVVKYIIVFVKFYSPNINNKKKIYLHQTMNGISNLHTETKESRKNITETIIKLHCMMPNNNLSRRLREDDTNTVIY